MSSQPISSSQAHSFSPRHSDKIIRRANEKGDDPLVLSQRFIDEFHVDMEHLNCLPPTLEPKATDFIPEMIETIQSIIRNGHAYAVDGGDVFFEVDSLPGMHSVLHARRGNDSLGKHALSSSSLLCIAHCW